ncbi:Hypothetical protein HVR_LOCUS1374 [uncultured virus]|nr:Hypothetical protein HVR_LOCUS1374 [uncultured virus]
MATVVTPLIPPQTTQLAPARERTTADLQQIPYDNDVTLLYKWAEVFQVPVRLMIVRPRTPRDAAITSGTQTFVFESLPVIVQRLSNEGESPAGMFDIITGYNKLINIDDIVMSYYDQLHRQDPRPDLYVTINQIYRAMDDKLVVDKFESPDDLQKTYDSWITQIYEKLASDMKRLDTIKEIQLTLAEVDQQPKIPFSPVIVNSTIVSFSPTIDGRPVTKEDGLDIFNRSIVSRYVPFLRFNDKYGRPLYRVYTGGKIENEPNYSVTIIPSAEANNKNTIYMTLWLGDPNSDGSVELHDAPRESFFTVVYHLDTNYLTIESPVGADPKKGLIRNEAIAFQRTQSALPNLVFGEGKEIKVRGDFNMWGMDFDETSFLDMVLLEPLMNVYLYVEENIKPFALKKRLDVHYRSIYSDMAEGKTQTEEAYISNSAAVSVTLTQKTTLMDEVVDVMDPTKRVITQARLPAGIPYIHVNISQAESRAVVNDFIPIFRLLMRYYLDNKDPIIQAYLQLLPELTALGPLLSQRKRRVVAPEPTILELTKKTTVNRRVNAKIRRLQEQAPDLFVLNYARRCQCPLQPIILEPNEIEAWKQKRVGPTLQERQIMPFPKDNPRWSFVCPDDNNPFPGVKLNHDLPNRDKFPYVPCCFKKDQMTPGVNSHYRDYVENRAPDRRVGAKAEKKISTRKILVPDRVAFLPRAVENIVKRYSDEYVDMVRYGIVYTPNSLLHCVCVAIDDPNYITQPTDEMKEAYVTRIRQHMLATIRPALLKQELYDYTNEEITNLFRDNSKFLDPSLFYRAVEETFNINIYVFAPPPPSGDETELGAMDIPRFKIFHARPLRLQRPTVVIMKTWGSESDALEYPQCELIVDYDKDNYQIMKLFGPEMTEVCHGALQDTLKTMTWSVQQNNTFDVHANIYYYIDHLSLFQVPAVSQFIDYNGKMRALTLNLGGGQLMTVAVIPSQPENLPVSNDVQRITPQTAARVFGEPTGVTRLVNGDVDGLWFQIMDITFGEYVPVIPAPGFNDKPAGPPNPITATGINVTGRLSKLRRTLSVIVQIARWLYELARSKQNIDPTTFASQFMVMDQAQVRDSSTYYDLDRIPRRLPNVETIQEAIRILEPLAPTLFNQGRIIMYSPVFADRIVKMLRDYSNLRFGMPPEHIEFIENFYETEADFIDLSNAKIFMNEKDLNAWLTSLKSSQNYSRYFNIRRRVEIAMGFSPDPYMYQDDDGKIFIIQNVVGGTKAKALAVAQTWYDYRVNIGSEPQPLNIVPIHMVYGVSPASTLIPVEDLTGGSNFFLKLVYYGTYADKLAGKEGRYAAILEIL